jgi:3'(2'), 5'-bisphosphate nucleotidase
MRPCCRAVERVPTFVDGPPLDGQGVPIVDLQGLQYLALADRLLPAILAAGRLEVGYFTAGVEVEAKGDLSPVTVADREAEAILLSALADAAPGVPVVAEEAAAGGSIPAIGNRFFLVDPLDGTKSFISGDPDFTINVALIEDSRPRFGVVYAPASQLLFAALGPATAIEAVVDPACGAKCFADIAARQINTRKPDLAALAAVASRTHGAAEAEALLLRWNVRERRNIGSSLPPGRHRRNGYLSAIGSIHGGIRRGGTVLRAAVVSSPWMVRTDLRKGRQRIQKRFYRLEIRLAKLT